ncbi:hypothetical protein D3C76_1555890 [compost metagenome]
MSSLFHAVELSLGCNFTCVAICQLVIHDNPLSSYKGIPHMELIDNINTLLGKSSKGTFKPGTNGHTGGDDPTGGLFRPDDAQGLEAIGEGKGQSA